MMNSYEMARKAGAFGADEEIARLRAERDAALSLLRKTGEALNVASGFVAAWSGYYKVAYQMGEEIHPKHQETLEQIQAALADLRRAGVLEGEPDA